MIETLIVFDFEESIFLNKIEAGLLQTQIQESAFSKTESAALRNCLMDDAFLRPCLQIHEKQQGSIKYLECVSLAPKHVTVSPTESRMLRLFSESLEKEVDRPPKFK